jgi:uncharacterized protein YndB with AHSA1/START domain
MSSIHHEIVYAHPIERVWTAITSSDALAAWLMENDFRPRVGHRFQFRAKPQPGWRGYVDCEVLELDPPRRMRLSWVGDESMPVTYVTFALTAVEGGTRLVFDHTGFVGVKGFFVKSMMNNGWGKKMLRGSLPRVLATLASGSTDLGTHACEGEGEPAGGRR